MFRVVTRGFSQEFERWTDALDSAKALRPKCKSLFQDIRIYDGENLVWVYDRLHVHPQYIGPRTYRRLALLFLEEAMAEPPSGPENS